ncbi:uncharacterized protein [Amphiura filiformis]|uniref:uncharacterized protein n=1 Tax=Amphiura filiformis TaxID=82378 RepID=UPI003B223472
MMSIHTKPRNHTIENSANMSHNIVLLMAILCQTLSGTFAASSTLSSRIQPTPSQDTQSTTSSLATEEYETAEEWTTILVDLQPTPVPTPQELATGSSHITPTPTPPQLTIDYSQITPTPLEMQSVQPTPSPEQLISASVSSTVLYTPKATMMPSQRTPTPSITPSPSAPSVTPSVNVDFDVTTIIPTEMQTIDVSLTVSMEEEEAYSSELTPLASMVTVTMEPTPSMSMVTDTSAADETILLSTYLLSPSATAVDEASVSLLISASSVMQEVISPTKHVTPPMQTSIVGFTTPSGTFETMPDVTTMSLIDITEQTTPESGGTVTVPINETNFTTSNTPERTTFRLQTNSSQVASTGMPDVTTENSSGVTTVFQTQQPSSEVNQIAVDLTITFDGDCQPVLAKEQDFKDNLISTLTESLTIETDKLKVNQVKCGSVVTDITLIDNNNHDVSYDLSAEIERGNFTILFEGRLLTAKHILFKNGPLAETTPTSGIDNGDDNNGIFFKEQQMLIYYLIGSVLGVILVIVAIVLMHHCVHRKCQTHAQSFNVNDGPVVKLSEFNMAHTYIPRPRSIYSENFGADGRYSMYGFNSSHSSAYYSSDDDLSKQCEEIPETETIRRFSNEFGHSVPQWDLPRLEGVVRQNEVNATLNSSTSTLASSAPGSFRSPPRGSSPPHSTVSSTSSKTLLAHHHHRHNHNPKRPRKAPPPPPPSTSTSPPSPANSSSSSFPPPPNIAPPPPPSGAPPHPPSGAPPPPPPPPPPLSTTSSSHSSSYRRDVTMPHSRPSASVCSDCGTDSSGDTRSLIRNGSDSTPSISGLDNPGLVSDTETDMSGSSKPPRPPPPPRSSTLTRMDRIPVTV